MNSSLAVLLLVLFLIVLQAVISGSYAALMNARTGSLRDLAGDGDKRAVRLLTLLQADTITITYYTASTLLKFTLAAVAWAGIDVPTFAGSVALLLLLACVVIVLGDTVPEAVGSTHATVLMYGAGRVMNAVMWLFKPLVSLLIRFSQIISALFNSNSLVNTVTEEEIMTLVDAGHTGGAIEDEEKEMIYSVLQLSETHVREMMTPRIDIKAVGVHHSLEDAMDVFINTGLSRIPVYEDSIDNVRGLLYAKDMLPRWKQDQSTTISAVMRPAYFVPETKSADELLKELQQRKVHMAIVVDEYGGTAGLVTIEDIIEEIIGDIQDEYDLYEEDEYEQTGENEYIVDAGIDLDDFNDLLDLNLPTEDSDTLGGFIYTHFGRVPEVDEEIDSEKLYLRVMSVDGRRIRKAYVRRKFAGDAEMDDAPPALPQPSAPEAEEKPHDTT